MFCVTFLENLKYFLKLSVFVAVTVLMVFLYFPILLIKPFDFRNGWIPGYITIYLGKILGASFKFQGLENIHNENGGVVVVNHQSVLDIIVMANLYTRMNRPILISSKKLFYIYPPLYLAFLLVGGVSLNLRNKESSKISINKQIDIIKNKNGKLLIFPEGTRNYGDFVQFKKGAFHVAIESQTNIQPVVVGKYQYFDSRKMIFGRGTTIIKVLPEITTKGLTRNDLNELIEKTRDLMQKEYELLNKEQ